MTLRFIPLLSADTTKPLKPGGASIVADSSLRGLNGLIAGIASSEEGGNLLDALIVTGTPFYGNPVRG
jgi:hypothetical protein